MLVVRKLVLRASTRLQAVRAFSGNWEYPKVEGSVADITKALTTIGARLSIPTAPLYFTPLKIDHIVREMKGADELQQVQKTLLLCDAKMAYPSTFAAGSFLSACVKQDAADTALDFLRQAENVRHYVKNQSLVRLAEHYAAQQDQETVDEIVRLMEQKRVPTTYKMYTFRVLNAKKQGKWDEAVAIAKQAANDIQINSHLIIELLQDQNGGILKEHIPLAKYLADKGDVYVNARLADILAGGDGKLPEPEVEESEQTEETKEEKKEAEDK
ncbi:hypothetical protein PF005_g8446 [Phytophthora fragariae]|uniref:Pentacotripeptide-repeat region of PRORP domain-containing protein n=1 Tax=Phytophthora fragariae TaxID=53985 RepID=A0A6A3U599_9STRA|nr:hypothetical protein PF003_g19011 [Phytophthora fragariae]KAE8940927.1 hypothetical protein PF009_g9280 [Phytophthora fragariae]KAE9119025.1 hypothetical protein PF007_g8702 [Phytophthora fragariae]KAE9146699.1 hypothetical protein PF006_g8547 [Phytophthora fragariae]KAE9217980.1 hypothetical protein PF005_g8446 [Phytophthora fragariae]